MNKKRGIAPNNNNGSYAQPEYDRGGNKINTGHSQPRQHGGASDQHAQQVSSSAYRTQSSTLSKPNYAGSNQIGGGGANKKENIGQGPIGKQTNKGLEPIRPQRGSGNSQNKASLEYQPITNARDIRELRDTKAIREHPRGDPRDARDLRDSKRQPANYSQYGGNGAYKKSAGGQRPIRASNNNDSITSNKDKFASHRQYQNKESPANTNARKVGQNLVVGQNTDNDYSTDSYPKQKSSNYSRGSSSRVGASNGVSVDKSSTPSRTNTSERSETNQHSLRCYNCKYRVDIDNDEGYQEFDCDECGSYIICDYCYEDYLEKNDQQKSNQYNNFNDSGDSSSSISDIDVQDVDEGEQNDKSKSAEESKKEPKADKKRSKDLDIDCVYCWSKKTLTDICVKSMKSFGFLPKNGQNKIPISTLSKDKVKKLANLRVIQKTLVYVIGLAPDIASESKLRSLDYFGQYGKIDKIVINTNNPFNGGRGGPSYSAYMTFANPRDAADCILSVDQFLYNDRLIRASFGTSKFCQYFLSAQKCSNKDCLYLHELRADLEAYTKEDMQSNKFIFQEQQKIAIKLSKALEMTLEEFKQYNIQENVKLKEAFQRNSKFKYQPSLPKPDIIYEKKYHFLDETLLETEQRKEKKKQRRLEKQKAEENRQKASDLRKQEKVNDEKMKFEIKNQKSEENDKVTDATPIQTKPGVAIDMSNQAIQINNEKIQTNVEQKKETESNIAEPKESHAQITMQNIASQGAACIPQKKNPKLMQQQDPGNVQIQLANQKDFSHDQIDRSLSKIRVQQSKAQGVQPSDVMQQKKTDEESQIQQSNGPQNSNLPQKYQISPETKNDPSIQEGKKEITSLNLPGSQQTQEHAQAHPSQKGAGKEAVRYQMKQKKKADEDSHPIVPEQRQNKHQVTQDKMSPRDQQKPITETTSADARQLINKTNHGATSMKEAVIKIERSHDKDKIESKSNNFNLTINSMKTLETIKVQKGFNDEILNQACLHKSQGGGAEVDHMNTTLSKTPSISDQQLASMAAAAKQLFASPALFKKNKGSRFKFAQSVDPFSKNFEDQDMIQVPIKIQELIERGIRTVSNSLSTVNSNKMKSVKSTAAQEAREEAETGINREKLNQMLEEQQRLMDAKSAQVSLLDIKELRERWYTKSELMNLQNQPPNTIANMNQNFRNQNKTISKSPPTVKTTLENIAPNQNTNQNPQSTHAADAVNVNLTRVKYQIKGSSVLPNKEDKQPLPNDTANILRRNKNMYVQRGKK